MKKAQSAMEYLITYGWAILIILIVLGGLFYLGVFDPEVPNGCNLPAPFVCKDIHIDESGLSFVIGNVNVNSIFDVSINVNGENCNEIWINDVYGNSASNIKNQELNIECKNVFLDEGNKVTSEINLNYIMDNLEHSISGSGSGSVESGFNYLGGELILHMDENILDSSKNDFIGTIYGGVNCNVEGKLNQGCEFDGIDDSLTYGDILNETNPWTISLWKKNYGGSSDAIFGLGNANPSQGHWILDYQTSLYILFSNGTSSGAVWSPGALVDARCSQNNVWNHVVLTYDGTNVNLYCGGDLLDSKVFLGNMLNPVTFILGKWGTFNGNYFNGTIDEVLVYSRALDEEEISNLYDSYN